MQKKIFAPLLFLILSRSIYSLNVDVLNTNDSGAGSLRQALIDVNAFSGSPDASNTITIDAGAAGTVFPASLLPLVFNNLTGKTINITGPVDGGGVPTFTVDGSSALRGLLATPPLTGSETLTLNITNLNFSNTQDTGGVGAGGGGGIGGALFIGTGVNASLTNVTFTNAAAYGAAGTGSLFQGGGGMSGGTGGTDSGSGGSGGGGGIGGAGGNSLNTGGGGGGGIGSSGGIGDTPGGGGGGGLPDSQGGSGTGNGVDASATAGGNGGGLNPGIGAAIGISPTAGGNGGGGGGGGYTDLTPTYAGGQAGGIGGGGGGGPLDSTYLGGFGGGGGGASDTSSGGGGGGFGGGGGGASGTGSIYGGVGGVGGGGGGGGSPDVAQPPTNVGGFAGGNGGAPIAGWSDGAGVGGAIFIQDGATLTINSGSFSGSDVSGSCSSGLDIFMNGSADLNVAIGSNLTAAIGTDSIGTGSFYFFNPIAGSSTGTLTKSGSGSFTISLLSHLIPQSPAPVPQASEPDWQFQGTLSVTGGTLAFSSNIQPTAAGTLALQTSIAGGSILDLSNISVFGYSLQNLSGSGSLILPTNTLTLKATTPTTFSGTITGANLLNIPFGSAQVTLAGASPLFTGSLTISSTVTLALQGSGALPNMAALNLFGSGIFDASNLGDTTINNLTTTIDVRNANSLVKLPTGTLTIHQTADTNYLGKFTGSGSSLKTGSSKLTLLNNSSGFTGPMTISAGTLALGVHSSFTGSISNAGSVTVSGGATFDASGVASTSINTLSGAGAVILPTSSMTIVQNVDGIFSGTISGSAALTKTGSNQLTLSGNSSSFTGSTTISLGTVRLSGSGSIANSSAVTVVGTFDASPLTSSSINNLSGSGTVMLPSSTLTLNQSSNLTFSGAFSGTGNCAKSGSAILTLSGNSSAFTGIMNVSAGTVSLLSGSLGSDVNIASGATLKGSGHVNKNVVVTGTLSPGNSIGTITVGGNLSFAADGVLSIEIAPGINNNSLVTVGGTATTNGTLVVVPDVGVYNTEDTYTFLTAATVDHTIPFVFVPPVGFDLQIVYADTFVELTFMSLGIVTTGLTGNELTLANYFNGPAADTLGATLTVLAGLSGDTLKEALDTISPSRNSFTTFVSQNVLLDLSDYVSSYLEQERFFHTRAKKSHPLTAAWIEEADLIAGLESESSFQGGSKKSKPKKEQEFTHDLWVTGFGDFATETSARQNPSFSVSSGGVLFGANWTSWEHGLVGLAGGYATASLKQDDFFGKGSFDGAYLSVYGQTYLWDFFLEGALWGGYQKMKNERNISYPGFYAEAESSHNSYQINPHLLFGYDARLGFATLEPFVSLDWAVNFEEGFQESGAAPFNVKEPHKTSSMLRTETGLNTLLGFQMDPGALLLRLKGSYVYKKLIHTGQITAALIGVPSSFTVESLTGDQNLGSGTVEIIWKHKKGPWVSALYTGEFGSGYISNQAMVRFGLEF